MQRAFTGLFLLCLVGCETSDPPPPYRPPPPVDVIDDETDAGPIVSRDAGKTCVPHDAPIRADGIDLPVPFAFQQCSEWCWAGSLAMVGNYYGKAAAECEFVQVKTGYPCCNYAACAYPQCNTIGYGSDIMTLLSRIGVHNTPLQGALSETALKTELSNGRPVIVNYYNTVNGHYAVLTGFQKYGQGYAYHVMDPWPGFGQFWTDYQSIRNGPGGNTPWAYTFTRLSPSANGCNPAYNPGCGCPAP